MRFNEQKGKSIAFAELGSRFSEEISRIRGGENIRKCFQCGTCVASCPVRAINDKYNPRKIIRMAILGMRERVLSSDFIWLCSACYTCHQRCPQEVKITDVMEVLKNLAVKEGYIHPSLIMQAELIGNLGRLYAIEEFDNRRRIKIGLPLVHPKCNEIVQLFEVTGLVKQVYGGRKESK